LHRLAPARDDRHHRRGSPGVVRLLPLHPVGARHARRGAEPGVGQTRRHQRGLDAGAGLGPRRRSGRRRRLHGGSCRLPGAQHDGQHPALRLRRRACGRHIEPRRGRRRRLHRGSAGEPDRLSGQRDRAGDRGLHRRQRREAHRGARHRHRGADAQAKRPVRPCHRAAGVRGRAMASTVLASGTAADRAPGSLRRYRWWLLLIVLPVLLIAVGKTGLVSDFQFLQLILMIVYSISVLGLILLTGFNGQISLGHGAFFAVGAYTAAILIDQHDWPFWATLPAAALACFVAGYLFGLPALRLEGHYLALATFALAVAVPQILKYRHIEPVTKGVMGINVFKSDPPFGLPLSNDQWMFLVVLAIAALMFWIARNLLDSRTGRALIAIR